MMNALNTAKLKTHEDGNGYSKTWIQKKPEAPTTLPTLQIKLVNHYGTLRGVPSCPTSNAFAQISNRKTFDLWEKDGKILSADLDFIEKSLGYSWQIVAPQRG